MIAPMLIGQGGPLRSPLAVYLRWDRHSAMADFLVRQYGIEVPQAFIIPHVTELAPVKWSVCDWPERVVIEEKGG